MGKGERMKLIKKEKKHNITILPPTQHRYMFVGEYIAQSSMQSDETIVLGIVNSREDVVRVKKLIDELPGNQHFFDLNEHDQKEVEKIFTQLHNMGISLRGDEEDEEVLFIDIPYKIKVYKVEEVGL